MNVVVKSKTCRATQQDCEISPRRSQLYAHMISPSVDDRKLEQGVDLVSFA